MKSKSNLLLVLLSLIISITNYAQCPVVTVTNPDNDGDGVANSVDVDDDNDGILDTDEGFAFTTNPLYQDYLSSVSWSGKDALSYATYSATNGAGFHFAGYKDNGTETLTFTIYDVIPNVVNTLTFDFATGNPVNPNSNAVRLYVDNVQKWSFTTVSGATGTPTMGPPASILHGSQTITFTPTSSNAVIKVTWTTAVDGKAGSDGIFAKLNLNNAKTTSSIDTDKDGIPNHQDLDSDNDGIVDAIEANPANAANVGSNSRFPDGNNIVSGCEDGSTDFAVTTPQSSDADGVPDYLDLDSDADGCSDADEAGTSSYTVNTTTTNYTVDNATPDGRTNAPFSPPANANWRTYASNCAQALPVTFGNINAMIQSGQLQVKWSTETEKECDHFEIEVSKDGKTWSKAGDNVKSKATDPNATTGYTYTQSISLNGMAVMGISLFLLSMGMMFRKNKWLGVALVAVSMSTVLYGCTKNDSDLSSTAEKVYVRIKQVDKDGTASYSKVVTAIVK